MRAHVGFDERFAGSRHIVLDRLAKIGFRHDGLVEEQVGRGLAVPTADHHQAMRGKPDLSREL